MNHKIALLCQMGDSSAAVANALVREFGSIAILVEDREPRGTMLKRRMKRLGLLQVVGQLAFLLLVLPILRRLSRARVAEIVEKSGISLSRAPLMAATRVDSINSMAAVEWLRKEHPSVVVVNGTRIISKSVLEACGAAFVNTHCGITPEYRGCHGGYWALRNGDREHCGVTVHLVDAGIDTGDILAQQRIQPTRRDNFVTYPYLQIAAALPLLIDAVYNIRANRHKPTRREAPSALWYHPTIGQYLASALGRSAW